MDKVVIEIKRDLRENQQVIVSIGEYATNHSTEHNWTLTVPDNQIKLISKNKTFLEKLIWICITKKQILPIKHLFSFYPIFDYISKIDSKTKERILSYLSKFDASQLNFFIHVLEYNSKLKNNQDILFDLERIKGRLFNKKIFIHDNQKFCPETQGGFWNSLKGENFNYGEIEFNGKLIPVLIKSIATTSEGFNRLAIDPKTKHVYSMKSDPKTGKFVNVKLEFGDIFYYTSIKPFFDKELARIISEKYSPNNLSKVKEGMKKVLANKKINVKRKQPIKTILR